MTEPRRPGKPELTNRMGIEPVPPKMTIDSQFVPDYALRENDVPVFIPGEPVHPEPDSWWPTLLITIYTMVIGLAALGWGIYDGRLHVLLGCICVMALMAGVSVYAVVAKLRPGGPPER